MDGLGHTAPAPYLPQPDPSMRLLPSLLCFSLLSSITSAQQVNQLVSLTPGGQTGAGSSGFTNALAISADGRFVAFDSYANDLVPGDSGELDVFVRDMLLGTTERVSVDDGGVAANGDSYAPSISDDGRFVVFSSAASSDVALILSRTISSCIGSIVARSPIV